MIHSKTQIQSETMQLAVFMNKNRSLDSLRSKTSVAQKQALLWSWKHFVSGAFMLHLKSKILSCLLRIIMTALLLMRYQLNNTQSYLHMSTVGLHNLSAT